MLIHNHYLEELGIKSTDFPFYNEDYNDDPRYEVDEEGFRECEFWSLDFSLACYIYSHLCYFRDYCLVGYPSYMTAEQWKDTLNKMIKAFRLYIEKEDFKSDLLLSDKQKKQISKNRQKQITYGMKLFVKYFGALWF